MVLHVGLPIALITLFYYGTTLFKVHHVGVDIYYKLFFANHFAARLYNTYRFFTGWLIAQWTLVVLWGFYLVVYGSIWINTYI